MFLFKGHQNVQDFIFKFIFIIYKNIIKSFRKLKKTGSGLKIGRTVLLVGKHFT